MPYNNYMPMQYPTAMPPMMPQYGWPQMPVTAPAPPQPQASQAVQPSYIFDWVRGEEAANAYSVEPGKAAVLMEIDNRTFYIAARGADGVPKPLQIFDYHQRQAQIAQTSPPQLPASDYITRKEFDELARTVQTMIPHQQNTEAHDVQ